MLLYWFMKDFIVLFVFVTLLAGLMSVRPQLGCLLLIITLIIWMATLRI